MIWTSAAVLAPSPAALAQAPAANGGSTDVKKALETRKSELESTEAKARQIEQDVDALRAEREKLNAQLLDTAALVQKSEAQLTATETRLDELGAQEKMVRGSLNERYANISKLLSALQRMGRNPPPVMITRREDALKMVRSAMLLSSAFPGMRTQAIALSEDLNNLVTVMDKMRTEGERVRAETQRLSDMRIRLSGLMETKKQSLTERRAELEQVRVAAAEISKSVEDLNGLFDKLNQTAKESDAELYDQELKRKAAAAPSGSGVETVTPPPPAADDATAKPETATGAATGAPGTPAAEKPAATETKQEVSVTAMVTLPPKTANPKVVELAPHGNSLVPGNPGRIKPSIAFSEAKAKLPLPANGRRVLSFGDKTQYGGHSKGIVIETRSKAQITSPCDGWIVYAGEFRSYGQLLIINAGGGYHVLLAGLSQIDVQPGQFVLAAEPVGTMIGTTKTQASTQSSNPVLYVEFRKDGDPINPDPWWVESQQKAQNEQKVQG